MVERTATVLRTVWTWTRTVVTSLNRPLVVAVSVVVGIVAAPLILAIVAKYCGTTHELGEMAKLSVEMAKLIFSWPVLVACAILGFKKPLRDLLNRLRRVDVASASLSFVEAPVFSAAGITTTTTSTTPTTTTTSTTPTTTTTSTTPTTTPEAPEDEALDAEVKEAQRWKRWWWFERVCGSMNRTQARLIEFIARRGRLSLTISEEVTKFIAPSEEAEEAMKNIRWLETAGMVTVQQNSIEKTELTDEFVTYMHAEGNYYLDRWLTNEEKLSAITGCYEQKNGG